MCSSDLEKDYKVTTRAEDLPKHIKDVDDSILGEVISCQHSELKEDGLFKINCNEQCSTAFRILPYELQFYKSMNLPLPRLCPNCRHYQRLKFVNPPKLWKRKCMCRGENPEKDFYKNTVEHFHGNNPCPAEFETAIGPDRKEIVYCKECYQDEFI